MFFRQGILWGYNKTTVCIGQEGYTVIYMYVLQTFCIGYGLCSVKS